MSCVLPVCRWSFHSRTGSDEYLSAWSASQTLMTDGQCVADTDSNTEIKGKSTTCTCILQSQDNLINHEFDMY